MISSPSRREAASTRSAIWAGWSLASLGWGMRRRTVGTCPTNGSTLAQSRKSPVAMRRPSGFGSSRRSPPRAPGVDADHAPGAGDVGQLDLVGAHQARALDVDQLAVEHVALEQHLLLAALEVAQVELGLAQHDAVAADLGDAIDPQVGGAPGDLDQKPGDRRIADAAEPHDRVLDASQPLAVAVAQRPSDQRGEVQDRRCRHVVPRSASAQATSGSAGRAAAGRPAAVAAPSPASARACAVPPRSPAARRSSPSDRRPRRA